MIFRMKRSIRHWLNRMGKPSGTAPAQSSTQLRMIRTFDDRKIPQPGLAPEYQMIPYRRSIKPGWFELLNKSGEFRQMNIPVFEDEILTGLLKNGGILIGYQDQLVACAAICRRKLYDPYAVLMYVVVLSEHRGKGLGEIVTARAMEVAHKNNFPGVILYTDDGRIPAIKTYLKLGFTPDTQALPETRTRWANVLRSISGQG